MSIRHDLLAALNQGGYLSVDDLMGSIGETNRKKVVDNLNAAKADILVDRSRDEVTRLPVYHITPVGRSRLAEGVRSMGGENSAKRAATTKPATGALGEQIEASQSMLSDSADVPCVTQGMATPKTKKTAPARYRNIDVNGGLVNDADYNDEMEARTAAVDHAREHKISVDVCQVIGTANFDMVPMVNWSSVE